jgi:hypothetical protein
MSFQEKTFEFFTSFKILKRWIETILTLTVNNIIVCINLGNN